MKRRGKEQTENMSFIRISDGGNGENMFYLYNQLNPIVTRLGGKAEIECGKINVLNINVDKSYAGFVRAEAEDKIADVITVNYKYKFFTQRIKTKGLENFEKELLMCALICADLEEDKRYVCAKMALCEEYSINGTFNFRMNPLKRKWEEITGYIPAYFNSEQLREFIIYILKEKKGKKVYIDKDTVYDKNFNKLQRVILTDNGIQKGKIVREVLLSASGEVELNDKVSEVDEKYLKEYFGDKILFGKGYFTKSVDKRSI